MAIATVPEFLYPFQRGLDTTSSTSLTIANDQAVAFSGGGWAFIFMATKTSTITQVGYYFNATGGNATMVVSIQGVTAGGIPDGSNIGSTGTMAITAAGYYEATVSASVTAGTLYAAVILTPSATSQTSGKFAGGPPANYAPLDKPYYLTSTAGTFARNTGPTTAYMFAIGYSTSDYIYFPNSFPFTSWADTSVTTGAAVKAWGAAFTPTVPIRTIGAQIHSTSNPLRSGLIYIMSYGAPGSILTGATATFDTTFASAADKHAAVLWDGGNTTVTLAAGTQYRMVYVPTSASTLTLGSLTVNATGLLGALPGGSTFMLTTNPTLTSSVPSGTWTDTNTAAPFGFYLRCNGLDDGVSAGGTNTAVLLSDSYMVG